MYVAYSLAHAPARAAVAWPISNHAKAPHGHRAALDALRAETTRVAAVTVAATSIAVHLERCDPAAAARFSMALMRPAFSAAATAHVERLTAGEDQTEIARAWTLVQTELAAANHLSTAHGRGEVTTCVVREAWQRASRTLLEWFALMQPLMIGYGALADAAHDAPTLALLRRAAAGETPALDVAGAFAVPAAGERRSETRHEVSIPVMVTVGARQFGARLANISSRGLLIVADRQVPSGRVISVEFADGRRLWGTVCWSNVRRIGVELTSPLAADDALWLELNGMG